MKGESKCLKAYMEEQIQAKQVNATSMHGIFRAVHEVKNNAVQKVRAMIRGKWHKQDGEKQTKKYYPGMPQSLHSRDVLSFVAENSASK